MEERQKSMKLKLLVVLAVFVVGAVFTSYAKASAAYDPVAVQGLVEKARVTLNDFTFWSFVKSFKGPCYFERLHE